MNKYRKWCNANPAKALKQAGQRENWTALPRILAAEDQKQQVALAKAKGDDKETDRINAWIAEWDEQRKAVHIELFGQHGEVESSTTQKEV